MQVATAKNSEGRNSKEIKSLKKVQEFIDEGANAPQ